MFHQSKLLQANRCRLEARFKSSKEGPEKLVNPSSSQKEELFDSKFPDGRLSELIVFDRGC